jgi:protein-arginine deiminase
VRRSKLRSGYACAFIALVTVVLVACGNGGGGGGGIGAFSTAVLPPVTDFTANPTTTDTATQVQFTDQSAYNPTSWSWDFDNDTVIDSTVENPVYTYTTPGTYTVTLATANANGADSKTRIDYSTVTTVTVGAADIDADTNRDGAVTAADDTNEDTWNATQGAVYYYNLDDDDNNNTVDASDTTSSGSDTIDLASVFVRQYANPPAGGSIRVAVSTAAQGRVRIFQRAGTTWTSVYATGANFPITYAAIQAGDIEFGIEARDRMQTSWDGRVTLTLEVLNSGGNVVDSDALILRVAPPLMATNLWRAEEYNVVNITGGGSDNGALRTAMQTICTAGGITYREVSGATYGGDRWLQDSSEFAVIQLPSSTGPRRVVDHVMQLARWRPCDDWCEDVLLGSDYDFFARFSTNNSSHNYGGNVEIVPPYTGKPYGRVMHGGGTGTLVGTTTTVTEGMVQAYRDFWDAAAIQGQFQITSEWLAVGHVDEFTAFVPAPNTARGWVCLIASPDRAVQVLQATQTAGQGGAAVFAGRAGHATTVNAILADTALMTLNGQVQARIDTARNQLKAATNLTDADFIELPTLFENVGSNYMAAYNPGVVNMITLPSTNGTVYFAVPDPEGPDIAGVDQWRQDILNQMNPLTNGGTPFNITFVDVFFSYHTLLGEAHCGSNFTRTPPADDWWNK